MAHTKTSRILKSVGRELKAGPPAILEKTFAKKGQAAMEEQRRAILLSKARAKGAKVPGLGSVRAEAAKRLLRRK